MHFNFQMRRVVTVLIMHYRRTTSFHRFGISKSDSLSGGAPEVRKYCLLFDAFCEDILSEHRQIFMSSLSSAESVFGLRSRLRRGEFMYPDSMGKWIE
jgi:hypothetical protein